MHPRKQLRDAVKTALATAVPEAAGRIGGFRSFARAAGQLPAIEVTTPAELVDRLSDDGALRRAITLSVVALAAPAGDLEDALDALAEKIERAVFGAVQAGPFAASVQGMASEFDPGGPDEIGAIRPGAVTSTFQIVVLSDETDPSDI